MGSTARALPSDWMVTLAPVGSKDSGGSALAPLLHLPALHPRSFHLDALASPHGKDAHLGVAHAGGPHRGARVEFCTLWTKVSERDMNEFYGPMILGERSPGTNSHERIAICTAPPDIAC